MNSNHNIDVLLIHPGNQSAIYQGLGNSLSAIEPPAMAGLIATFLQKKERSVALIDAQALVLGPEEVATTVTDNYRPRLIVLVVYGLQPSASTQNMPAAGAICRALKETHPNTPILMTGTHPAALPERTLREEAIDFVCDREGPDTILTLVEALEAGTSQFDAVPNLWYRHDGKPRLTFHAPLLRNFNIDMPHIAWDLLPMDRYRAHNWQCFDYIDQRQPYASLYTSLGCPYHCSFCCINAPFGQSSYRIWHPDCVARQIDTLVNRYGVKTIKVIDEMFVLNRQHVLGICDRLIERDYDLNIWAYARIDTIKDEFLDKLRKAGFRWLALGIESGSKHIRDGVGKGRFGTQDILSTVRRIQDAGIYVMGNYIFGLPDDTQETMQETLDLALEANCEFANFYCAMAYPGSRLYNTAIENG